MSHPRTATRRSGFTLLECMVASTFLAIAVIGVSGLFISAGNQSQYQQETTTAVNLARQLLEEIASLPLVESDGSRRLGPETGETDRSLFTCVDDYHNYTDSTATTTNIGGRAIQLGDGRTYTRRVLVAFRDTPDGATSATGNFALVSVIVGMPSGASITIKRVVSALDLKM